ncbi:MAG: 6-bladed beta-propeller [Dehalobacterium sp.]
MRKCNVIITIFAAAFILLQSASASDDLAITDLFANPREFNSFTGNTTIQYTLSDIVTGKIMLEIYNNDGNLIRSFEEEVQNNRTGSISWEGKNLEDEPVLEGYYLADFSFSSSSNSIGTPEFQKAWGGWGNSAGKLYYPNGVAVDFNGNVYVADSNNNRIQKFSAQGDFMITWGVRGNGEGQFYLPMAVDIDSDGYVYVTDSYNHRIQKFDSEGNFIISWGNYGSGSGQLKYPSGIAVDNKNNIFVSDRDNHRVQKFDANGNFLAQWGSNGLEDGQFQSPLGLDVDTKGNVYVVDTNNHRIQKFDSTGKYLTKWGSQGIGVGQFSGLKDIALDSRDNVYAADGGNNRVQVFDAEGKYLTMWEHQFNDPAGIVCGSRNKVFIADTRNHQIQEFNFSAGASSVISDQVRLLVDNSAPKSEINISGTRGKNDWYISNIIVSLSAADNLSGIDKIMYSLDGEDYREGSTFSVFCEGEHYVHYYAVDKAGNKEEVNEVFFKIDKTPPKLLIVSPEDTYYFHSDRIKLDFCAEDDMSGIKKIKVFLDGQEYNEASQEIDLLHLPLSNHEIKIQSENYAGLLSEEIVKFNIKVSIESMIRSLERLYGMGIISNEDIFTGLKDKLKCDANAGVVNNNLKAFINQVEAQKGKEIPSFYAEMLIADARYIINLSEQDLMNVQSEMSEGKKFSKKLKLSAEN